MNYPGQKNDFWKIADQMRSEDLDINIKAFLEKAKENGIEIDINLIRFFDQHLMGQKSGFWISPENLVSFISKIASNWNPKSILDPACGSASFFLDINSSLSTNPQYIGIDRNKEILEIAALNLSKLNMNYKLLNEDFFSLKESIDKKFDLIISQPPFGRIRPKEMHGLKIRDIETAFLIDSLDLLEDNGNLIFIIPESFFSLHSYKNIRSYLLKKFSVEAIISLPTNTFYPYTGLKTNILILKNTNQRDKIFFAEYTDHESEIIIKNLIKENSNDNLSQGLWVNSELLKKEDDLWAFNRLKASIDFKRKKTKSKYNLKQLSKIIEPISDFKENEEILLIPRYLNKEIIFNNEIEEEHLLKDYYKFKIVENNILPQYLKIYLNSGIGKNQRNLISHGVTVKRIDRRGLDYIYIEIPDLKTQKEIVRTNQTTEEVYNKINILYDSFNNQVFNYSNVLEIMESFHEKISGKKEEEFFYRNLIWPFATSYHIAVKGSTTSTKQLDNYFNLFELISAFNAIVLLSALPEEIYEEEKKYIWNIKKPQYKKVSFGKWTGLYSRLIKTYRKRENYFRHEKEDFFEFLPFNKEFYDPLLNSKVTKSLDKVVEKRNKDAHGGSMPNILAKKIISELNEYLNDIFPSFRAYTPLKLVYIEKIDKARGTYTITTKILEGNSYSFDNYKIETDNDMDTKVLYLYNPITDDRLMLLPELVNLIPCEECGNCSLYFYNSLNDSDAKYISYQYEIHDHISSKEVLGKFLDVIDFKDEIKQNNLY